MTAVARRTRSAIGLALLGAGLAASTAASALDLIEAGQLAMERDPTVAVYRAQFEADRQAGDLERAGLLPTLSLKGSGYYADTDLTGSFGPTVQTAQATIKDKYPGWSATAELRQPLFRFDWFERRDRAKAKDALADVTRVDAVANVVQRVSSRYLDVVLAQDQLKQTEAEAKALRGSLDNTRQRFDVDLVPGTDVKEAQARDDLAQAQLIAARRSLDDALEAMSESTGVSPLTRLPGLREDVVLPLPMPNDAEVWVKYARDNAPNLAKARLDVDIARADYESNRAQSWPQLDLVASAGRQDSLEYVVGQRTDDARIGVELNLPIYSGGSNTYLARQGAANVAAREATLQQLQLETDRQVRKLFRSVQTRNIEVTAYRRSLDSAIAADIATRHGYDAGTRSIIEVLDGQSRVAQASRDWNTARYNLLSDLLALRRATGMLYLKDFADLNLLLEPDVAAAAAK